MSEETSTPAPDWELAEKYWRQLDYWGFDFAVQPQLSPLESWVRAREALYAVIDLASILAVANMHQLYENGNILALSRYAKIMGMLSTTAVVLFAELKPKREATTQ